MANSAAGTSDDAAPASGGDYQVFLSFRGPDTRHGFTDFLYDRLVDAGVHVFRDDDELRVGEVIGENLLSAINNSIIYIPIFSRTYASSKWCLLELAHIVDNVSKSENEKSILPIFLDVEPDDVKLKTPIYSDSLLDHERKFPEEVEAWRAALAEVGKIKGWNVKSSQAAIIKSVVKEVLEKLKIKQKLVTEHLVGVDERIKDLIKLLDVNHDDVRLLGIYGMGGIGKTTIAKVLYNQLCSHFGNCCSFLDGIRERSIKAEGIVSLQQKLLSDIVGSKFVINESEEGIRRIRETLNNKKILVVLDDVDKRVSIENIIEISKLNRGSRIIITTRDKDILQVEGFEVKIEQYEMQTMDEGTALRLFCWHAFRKDYPMEDYHRLSSNIVSSTGGLPLAIEVIGSFLNGKDQEIWEETLEKLKNIPEKKILEKLRISYDDLDKHHKEIFLDIACFFFNEKKTDAIYMWTDCQFYPKGGIKVLTDRCLVKIWGNDQFWMHDQLKALGKQIVREDNPQDLGKHSRLWIAEEALQIIRTKEWKDKVQALSVSIPEITNEDFERFPNLRFLELENGTYTGDFAKCHSNLRWFSWISSPKNDFGADNLYMNRLVVCKLYNINFKDDSKAWDLIKGARDLKLLSISDCDGITTIPCISKCLGLERLTIHRCSSLKRIECFIGNLGSLIELKIESCWHLIDLPEEIGELVKLKHFSLSGCHWLRELPSSIGNLTSLTELDLSGTMIMELPNSIEKLKSLRKLHFGVHPRYDRENHDWQFPSGIITLVNLEELVLPWSGVVGGVPIGIGELSSLRILNLEHTSVYGIPRTINTLHHLETLNLRDCHEIQELPELPTSLTCLRLSSESLLSVPNLSNLTNLVELLLSNRKFLGEKTKPLTGCNLRWIGRLSRLKKLVLDLLNVPAPPDLASLSHLEELSLSCLDLETLVQLPSSLLRLDFQFFSIRRAESLSSCLRLKDLSTLEFYGGEVEDIPLSGLPQLKELIICSCKPLQKLSIPLELRKLRQASVSSCPELVEIQVVGLSKSLESFCVCECKSLIRISGLPYLKNLENFAILCCNVVTIVEGLDELGSLSSLVIRECPSLGRSEISLENYRLRRGISLENYREEIRLDTSQKTKTEGRKKATAWWKKIRFRRRSKESRNKEKEKEKRKEVEFKLDLLDEKEWRTAVDIILKYEVTQCSWSTSIGSKKVTTIGNVDPVELLVELRKRYDADILSVRLVEEAWKTIGTRGSTTRREQ